MSSTTAPEQVIDIIYRAVLRREPDPAGREVFTRLLRAGQSEAELLKLFINSPEFQSKKLVSTSGDQNISVPPRFVPLDAPAMHVESEGSATEISQLIDRIGDAWTAMGIARPYYSVLTSRDYLPENINEHVMGHFWGSGSTEAATIETMLTRHGFNNAASKTCVEYGCGVGRVTLALAKKFKMVHAYDISAPHLELAKQRTLSLGINNIEFHLCTANIFKEKLKECDFFYSRIVFQHNPPPLIRKLIEMSLKSLKKEGIELLPVPKTPS